MESSDNLEETNAAKVDIRRFKSHERKFPWALLRKIVIVAVMLGLLLYLSKTINSKKQAQDLDGEEGFEIQVDLD